MSGDERHWALVLGGSSGLGLAAAEELSRRGMGVVVVHRDRRGAMGRIQPTFDQIAARGHGFATFNVDALAREGREHVLTGLAQQLGPGGRLRVLLHAIAHGNLRPLLGTSAHDQLDDDDIAHTVYAMGTSLVTWVQAIRARGWFAHDARVIALTSEGNRAAWPGYGAVAAAKAALESCVRGLAAEGAPHGLRANAIQAGVTDTPALRAIPGHEVLLSEARRRNPSGRLTTPADVARVVALLASDDAAWITGSVIVADGGEHLG